MSGGTSTQFGRNAAGGLDHCATSLRTGTALVGARRRKLICQILSVGERVGNSVVALWIGQGLRLAGSFGRRRSGALVVVVACWGSNEVW